MEMIQGFFQKLSRILLVISKSDYKEFPTNIKVFIIFCSSRNVKIYVFQPFFCIYFWDIMRIKKELKIILSGLNN